MILSTLCNFRYMARQIPRPYLSPLSKKFQARYRRLTEFLHLTWMQYGLFGKARELLDQFSQKHENWNSIQFATKSLINVGVRQPPRVPSENILSALKRMHLREIPEFALVNAICHFEACISDITESAYREFPNRYLTRDPIGSKQGNNSDRLDLQELLLKYEHVSEAIEEYNRQKQAVPDTEGDLKKNNRKLLGVMQTASNKQEVIDYILEERIMGIFYGDPLAVFQKDKLRFGIHEKMVRDCQHSLSRLREIICRRNLLIHDSGVVNRKYLREVHNSSYAIGDKLGVDRDYFYDSLKVMEEVGRLFTYHMCESVLGETLEKLSP